MRSLPILILLIAGAFTAQASAAPPLLTASSDEHLWIVRPVPADRAAHAADLLHHAIDMGGPHAAATVPLHFVPEAVAAFGDRVWIVSPPRALTVGSARDVYTLRIRKRDEIDLYVTEPDDRFAILETLPGDGDVVALAATAQGPVALLRYDRAFQAGAERSDAPGGATANYRLFQLRRDGWSASPLPVHVRLHESALLAVDGPELSRLNLLTSSPGDPSQTLLYRRDATGWSAQPALLEFDLRTVQSLTQVRGRLAAVIARPPGEVEIAYLRPGEIVPLATIALDEQSRAWAIAGMKDGFRKVTQSSEDDGRLFMRDIHWLTGAAGAQAIVTRPGLPTARLLHMTIMLTIAVVTILLVLIVRPGAIQVAPAGASRQMRGEGGVAEAPIVELPKGVAILSPLSRIMALLIDLAPGGVLALLIMRAPVVELLRMPIVTNSLDNAAPYLLMIAITFVHVTLSEMMKGTSLGKALVGGRVLSVASDPAGPISAKQALVRNLLKMLILMIPPLAIFALLSRSLQGFNDILARTLVVGDLPEEDSAASADADEE